MSEQVPEQEKMGAGAGGDVPEAAEAQPSFTYKSKPASGDAHRSANRDPKCVYVAACRCGAVELELKGQPRSVLCCYCSDCQAAGRHLELKAKEEGLPDPTPYSYAGEGGGKRGGAAYLAAFWMEHIKVVKGADALMGFKMSEKSKTGRTCCKHCRTSVVGIGGKNFPMNLRMLNPNTIKYVNSGETWQPVPKVRFGGKNGQTEAWKAAPEPKAERMPLGTLCGLLPPVCCPCVFPGKGEMAKTPDIPGMLDDPGRYTEVASAAAYHDLGLKAPGEKK